MHALDRPVIDDLPVGVILDKAAETSRPFHLTVGFRDPHRDETRGGLGNKGADPNGPDGDVRHIPVPDYKESDVVIPGFISDVPELRTEPIEYYKVISRLDAGVGMLLEELDKRNLADYTLVISISDNGVNSKTTLYDAGVRLPLLARRPGNTEAQQGGINPNMVSWIDILPTCLDWAAGSQSQTITTPYKRTGAQACRQIVSLELGRSPQSTSQPDSKGDEATTDTRELMIGRCCLQSYVYRGAEELFDLKADPEEVKNLANDTAYEPILRRMGTQLDNWQYQTDDV